MPGHVSSANYRSGTHSGTGSGGRSAMTPPSRLLTHEQATLQRLWQAKKTRATEVQPLGPAMLAIFKNDIRKRYEKLNKISPCWQALIPPMLEEHCALDNYQRGTLTVIVDSSSHLYELKQLLLSGLEKQMQLACGSAGLRKVVLKLGHWYDADGPEKRVKF